MATFINTDAPSHVHKRVAANPSSEEEKYTTTRRASITPFVVSAGGALGREATALFLKHLSV